jgi:hypothetical protein
MGNIFCAANFCWYMAFKGQFRRLRVSYQTRYHEREYRPCHQPRFQCLFGCLGVIAFSTSSLTTEADVQHFTSGNMIRDVIRKKRNFALILTPSPNISHSEAMRAKPIVSLISMVKPSHIDTQ